MPEPARHERGPIDTSVVIDPERLDVRPRTVGLLIAAIAGANDLPLFTGNPADFRGLEHLVRIVAV